MLKVDDGARALKTYFCWIPRLGGTREHGQGGLYRAATRSKARYLCYLGASDPYPHLSIIDIRVRRAPGYDYHYFRDGMMPQYATAPGEEDDRE